MTQVPSSFRDPCGFVFLKEGIVYRQVNRLYQEHYDHLINSGLYQRLVERGLLVPHQETRTEYAASSGAYKVLKPELLEFISYPYEWCFSELRDAAMATLEIEKIALAHGMTLKDASAYNIQFDKGAPKLVDTLSFEGYRQGEPWVAYKQFCEHFVAPLALMSCTDVRLSQLLRVYLDGIPLSLAVGLLPLRSRFNLHQLIHLHLHSVSQRHYASTLPPRVSQKAQVGRTSLLGLIDSLESLVKGLRWQPTGSNWVDYYHKESNYTPAAFDEKRQLVSDFLDDVGPRVVWDLGANTGFFSRVASNKGIQTISFDADPSCVEMNYLAMRKEKANNLLPLVLDIANPSPGLGWENRERLPIWERGHPDAILALALVHHFAISNNVPLGKIAEFLSKMCRWLIIEFVPKSDSNVQRLLVARKDIFPDYTREGFEREFSRVFSIQRCQEIRDSQRILYLMLTKGKRT